MDIDGRDAATNSEHQYTDVSENGGFSPQIIHFNMVFHYKPSILGYPYFWKHPYRYSNLGKKWRKSWKFSKNTLLILIGDLFKTISHMISWLCLKDFF